LAACASRATSAPSSGARDRPQRWAGAQWVRICLDPRLRRPTDPVRSVGWRSLPRPPLAPHGPAQDSPPAVHRLRWLSVLHQPRLRSRLTLGRLPLPRNPQASGVRGSHTDDATHSGIRTCSGSTRLLSRASLPAQRSPTNTLQKSVPPLRSAASASLRCRCTRTRPVSYYALFQ
jgi:hypothetical protein